MNNRLGLFSAVSTGVGMIIATSCFISLADGASQVGASFIYAIILVCLINMMAASSIAELNALMPNLTGGLAQYTLVGLGPLVTIVTMVGGYFISNIFAAPAEGAMFALVMHDLLGDFLPAEFYSISITIFLIIVNLLGVNVSTMLQSIIAAFMVTSLMIMGVIGAFQLTPAETVNQVSYLSTDIMEILPLTAVAFWLFIGSEFIIPIGKDMKNPKRDLPKSMFLSLGIMCVIQVMMVIGFMNYTPWADLGTANSPHVLYAVNMLGDFGKYWIILVAIFAAVSTQNSIIGCVAEICCGMAKIGLLPALFQKKNRRNAPYAVILLLGVLTIIIEASGLSSGEEISFLILVSSIFWMLSYIASHVNVIILRKKMKLAPRTYKSPLYPILQTIGIIGTAYMMFNISTDPVQRINIFMVSGILFIFLTIYAVYWVKFKMKMKLLKGLQVEEVMAMENPLYYEVNKDNFN